MIKTKDDLKFYLAADRFALGMTKKYPSINNEVWKYQILLRKTEYFKNNQSSLLNKLILPFYQIRKRRLGIRLGFDIANNVFGPGLRINHFGNIIVNGSASIGMWCDIQQGVNIGANTSTDGKLRVPKIGSNVWIGPGAKLFGDITVGSGAVIGANAVVNKDVPANTTVAGIPAKIIKKTGTESIRVAACHQRMDEFFNANPDFINYYHTHK